MKALAIDADGHVLEPRDLWTRHLPARLRDRGLAVVWDDDTQFETVVGEGRMILPVGVVGVGLAGKSYTNLGQGMRYEECTPGGFDPVARLADMDAEGIDVAVLYPSIGLFLGGLTDPELAEASCRVYNDWLAEFCASNRRRLVGVAAVPLQDVDFAVRELRRAVEERGLRGAFLRPNPHNGRPLHDPYFDPFWAEAERLGVPVGLHPSGTPDMPGATQLFNFQNGVVGHALGFQFDNQVTFSMLVCEGVLERFPRLQVLVLESGGGWIGHWMDRHDNFYRVYSWMVPGMRRKPSEYFRRQCAISFDPDEHTVPAILPYVGEDRVVWASDYPHVDATFPGVVHELEEGVAGLSEAQQRKILGTNARRLYGIEG